MRHCGGSQTDQGEVWVIVCHVTSALGTLRSEGHVITDFYPEFLKKKISITNEPLYKVLLLKKNLAISHIYQLCLFDKSFLNICPIKKLAKDPN